MYGRRGKFGCVIFLTLLLKINTPFICDVVDRSAVVMTDGWRGCNGLSKKKHMHKRTALSSSDDSAYVAMPGMHRIASLPKLWILGAHQASFVPAHLQSYLRRHTFRFNRRTSGSRGPVFRRLMEQDMVTGPVTVNDVIFSYNWRQIQTGGAN
ncbi:MAG: hypothetical protein B1H11_13250 [Desulfobacteraceae bacterium 4484_190.1]|nr:MAG: hypothetical protein B1H11_13250 [Desulfobacteraceae bacterium 4484_190.1]